MKHKWKLHSFTRYLPIQIQNNLDINSQFSLQNLHNFLRLTNLGNIQKSTPPVCEWWKHVFIFQFLTKYLRNEFWYFWWYLPTSINMFSNHFMSLITNPPANYRFFYVFRGYRKRTVALNKPKTSNFTAGNRSSLKEHALVIWWD